MKKISTYEIKRRWHDFRKDIVKNSWYRNRLIRFLMIAFLVSCDLSFYLFGKTKIGIAIGIGLGILYFAWYEKIFRRLNGSMLHYVYFGLYMKEKYIIGPVYTAALNCIIKLLWSRFTYRTVWMGLILICAFALTKHLLRINRRVLKHLATHDYFASVASGFLRLAKDGYREPEQRAMELLMEWVEAYDKNRQWD